MLGVYKIAFVLGTNTAKATPDRPFGDEMHDLMPSWKLNTLNQIGIRDIPTVLWTAEWISAPHKIPSPVCRVFSWETVFAPRVFPLPTIPRKINLAPKAFPLKIGRRAQFTREEPWERGWGKIKDYHSLIQHSMNKTIWHFFFFCRLFLTIHRIGFNKV